MLQLVRFYFVVSFLFFFFFSKKRRTKIRDKRARNWMQTRKSRLDSNVFDRIRSTWSSVAVDTLVKRDSLPIMVTNTCKCVFMMRLLAIRFLRRFTLVVR